MQKLAIIILLANCCYQVHAIAAVKPVRFFGRAKSADADSATATITTTTSFHGTAPITTSKVGEMIPSFEELVASAKASDVHVGKLLTAMKKMEDHMRQVGMKQGAKELANNIDKVQQLYVRAPADKRDSMSDLLKWEMETGGIYGSPTPGGKLPSKSAAMGLTWLGHNIRYQYNLCKQMLDDRGCDPVQAAVHAFQQHIRPHLPRTVSMLAQAAIPKLTPRTQSEFFSMLGGMNHDGSFGPQQETAVRREVHVMLGTWEPLLEEWSSVFDDLNLGTV